MIKFQLLPGEELEAVREKLVPSWLTFGLTTMIDEPPTARGGSPLDNPVFKAIEATIARGLPGRAGRALFPRLDGDRRPLLPRPGSADLRLLAVPHHEHRHPAGRPAPTSASRCPASSDGVELYTRLVRRLVV